MERVVPRPALWGWSTRSIRSPAMGGRDRVGRGSALRLLVMRQFAGIDLGPRAGGGRDGVFRFRHLFEEHDLGRQLLEEVERHLAEKGLKVATVTIVDAISWPWSAIVGSTRSCSVYLSPPR